MSNVTLCGDWTTTEDGDEVVCYRLADHTDSHSDGDERWNDAGERVE